MKSLVYHLFLPPMSMYVNQDITVGRFGSLNSKPLSIPLDTVVIDTNLPYTTAEGIWKKAAGLVSEPDAIALAPGLGQNDKMVKSKSGSVPHLITVSSSRYQ